MLCGQTIEVSQVVRIELFIVSLQDSLAMKRNLSIVAIVLVAVVLVMLTTLGMNPFGPSPVDAAMAKCVEQGWQKGDLAVLGVKTSGGILGSSGHVEFQSKNQNPAKTIRVELQKSLFSLNWKVVDYDEGGGEGQ